MSTIRARVGAPGRSYRTPRGRHVRSHGPGASRIRRPAGRGEPSRGCFDGPLAGGESAEVDEIFADPYLDGPQRPPLRLVMLASEAGRTCRSCNLAVSAGTRTSSPSTSSTPFRRPLPGRVDVALTDFAVVHLPALGAVARPGDIAPVECSEALARTRVHAARYHCIAHGRRTGRRSSMTSRHWRSSQRPRSTTSAAAARASVKAAGVVVDDTAVTPQYVQGFEAERELIIKKIAVGSLRNKLSSSCPASPCCSASSCRGRCRHPHGRRHLPRLRGRREGLAEALHATTCGDARAHRAPGGEDVVSGAIRTDFILSAEIMVIALNEVADEPFVSRSPSWSSSRS